MRQLKAAKRWFVKYEDNLADELRLALQNEARLVQLFPHIALEKELRQREAAEHQRQQQRDQERQQQRDQERQQQRDQERSRCTKKN